MKKKGRLILFVIFLLGIFLTGCSSKSAKSESAPQSSRDMAVTESSVANEAKDMPAESPAMAEEVGFTGNTTRKNKDQKLIYRASMSIEVTEGLEPLVQSLQSFIENHNGYIENMDRYRYGYDPVTQEQLEGISMRIRIPHEHYKKALQTISAIGVVVNESSSVDDVTLQYSDIESTLKMYKIEQDRLLEMLKSKTADIKDMIEIEKRLSEVRVEIEKQESARRALESLINYDTITLEINQVRRVSATSEPKTFGTRIKSTFAKSVDEAIIFMQDLVLGVTYMLIPGIMLLVIVLLLYIPIAKVRRAKKKRVMLPSNEEEDK